MNLYRRVVRWLARWEISEAEDRAFAEWCKARDAELEHARRCAYAIATAPMGEYADPIVRAHVERMRETAANYCAPKEPTP